MFTTNKMTYGFMGAAVVSAEEKDKKSPKKGCQTCIHAPRRQSFVTTTSKQGFEDGITSIVYIAQNHDSVGRFSLTILKKVFIAFILVPHLNTY